jgi:shikimate dehydrogenase
VVGGFVAAFSGPLGNWWNVPRAELFIGPVLLDAIYDPWPTPLAAAVAAAGGRVISGLQMLLHQAFAQVEQFTGLPAPREAMIAALH